MVSSLCILGAENQVPQAERVAAVVSYRATPAHASMAWRHLHCPWLYTLFHASLENFAGDGSIGRVDHDICSRHVSMSLAAIATGLRVTAPAQMLADFTAFL
jgi:hypothetical protein